jgi:hypothetical protein
MFLFSEEQFQHFIMSIAHNVHVVSGKKTKCQCGFRKESKMSMWFQEEDKMVTW